MYNILKLFYWERLHKDEKVKYSESLESKI